MLLNKRYLMAGASFASALIIGYGVQNSGAFAARSVEAPDLSAAPVVRQSVSSAQDLLPVLPSAPQVAAALPQSGVKLAHRSQEALPSFKPTGHGGDLQVSAFGVPCGIELTATAKPAAMVELELTASCHGDKLATISHQELNFSIRTSATGFARVLVPALDETATFEARFADDTTAQAGVSVPDLAEFDRVALQWRGESGLKIHALEFGATHGSAGHVWAKAARGTEYGDLGLGGFLTHLGPDEAIPSLHAEVYSFPSGRVLKSGVVRLSVEAAVTPLTCNREISATSLQLNAGQAASKVDLTLAMPGCDAVGEFLVLNNLLRDLKIAQN